MIDIETVVTVKDLERIKNYTFGQVAKGIGIAFPVRICREYNIEYDLVIVKIYVDYKDVQGKAKTAGIDLASPPSPDYFMGSRLVKRLKAPVKGIIKHIKESRKRTCSEYHLHYNEVVNE